MCLRQVGLLSGDAAAKQRQSFAGGIRQLVVGGRRSEEPTAAAAAAAIAAGPKAGGSCHSQVCMPKVHAQAAQHAAGGAAWHGRWQSKRRPTSHADTHRKHCPSDDSTRKQTLVLVIAAQFSHGSCAVCDAHMQNGGDGGAFARKRPSISDISDAIITGRFASQSGTSWLFLTDQLGAKTMKHAWNV